MVYGNASYSRDPATLPNEDHTEVGLSILGTATVLLGGVVGVSLGGRREKGGIHQEPL